MQQLGWVHPMGCAVYLVSLAIGEGLALELRCVVVASRCGARRVVHRAALHLRVHEKVSFVHLFLHILRLHAALLLVVSTLGPAVFIDDFCSLKYFI